MKTDKIKTLRPKQALFVAEYLIDFNASAAARRAGYSPKTAFRTGQENMQNPAIQAAIRIARDKLAARTEITQDKVLKEYAKLAFYDPRKFFDANGNLIKITDLDDTSAAAVAGMDVSRQESNTGVVITTFLSKIKLTDKKAALDSVAKILGMFEKDNSQKGLAAVMGILALLPDNIKTQIKDEVMKKIG